MNPRTDRRAGIAEARALNREAHRSEVYDPADFARIARSAESPLHWCSDCEGSFPIERMSRHNGWEVCRLCAREAEHRDAEWEAKQEIADLDERDAQDDKADHWLDCEDES